MKVVDATATDPQEVLIQRAGHAVANVAIRMLGGSYGRRVNVIAGKGNNGQDGLIAARLLQRRGVRCKIYDPNASALAGADLVIDAAYGTGFRDTWQPPPQPRCPVLAVDIPSGIDGLTGADNGSLQAQRTVTFGALKPGLLLEPGASRAGHVEVAGLGLEIPNPKCHLITNQDLAEPLSRRTATDHKWTNALRIIGGSPEMVGAAQLAAHGALRAGAGMVVVSSPSTDILLHGLPTEAVTRTLSDPEWVSQVLADLERFTGLLIGPGLGSDPRTLSEAAKLIERAPIPVIVDADGIAAIAAHPECVKNRQWPTVVTPHDGEFKKLTGASPSHDRCADVRNAAKECVVLLKGPTTLVASPDGDLIFIRSGDERLATAGSGDVLAGIIGALINYPPAHLATAAAAQWHGQAAQLGEPDMTASDLPSLLQPARSEMLSS
ncbi:MAG: NAD(P)H-hydrate dehydratase [Actinomycetota bacterium]|nr:NAD(P)H-hydrate dehydratase [Actinomycetota bacterium]